MRNAKLIFVLYKQGRKQRQDIQWYFKMVGVEKQDSLRFIKLLVGWNSFSVNLWENDRGDLFIRLPLQDKKSYVTVAVEEETLIRFYSDECTLGDFLKWSPSPFGWLQEEEAEHYMYLPDADLALLNSNARYSDLKNANGSAQ